MTAKLECSRDETINNLIMKKVVCPSAVHNVGTSREHQNDQVSTQKFLVFLGGEYSESKESFGADEDNVATSPNLENLCQRDSLLIKHNSWHGKECDILDPEGVFCA
jgi:hypothetical protein